MRKKMRKKEKKQYQLMVKQYQLNSEQIFYKEQSSLNDYYEKLVRTVPFQNSLFQTISLVYL